MTEVAPRPAYLEYEDFSHTALGLETYEDGLQHPIELRRLLTGDLSIEMTVSFKARAEETFQALAYQRQQEEAKRGVEIFDSLGRSVYNSFGLPQVSGEEREHDRSGGKETSGCWAQDS